jgi:ligand-binding sensor domain-containing protein/two-component sensor histidine kinase
MVLLATQIGWCQNLPGRWIGVDEGLSQGYIYNVNQDNNGFLWFGSKMGLNRYDGYDFVSYHHRSSDSLGINGNEILDLACDDYGNLIIQTDGIGLSYFYSKRNAFISFGTKQKDPFYLKSDVIVWFTYKKGGELLVMTDKSLHRIRFQSKNASKGKKDGVIEDFLSGFSITNEEIELSEEALKFWKTGKVYCEGNRYFLNTEKGVHELKLNNPNSFTSTPVFSYSKDGDEHCHTLYIPYLDDIIFLTDSGLHINGSYYKSTHRIPNKRKAYFIDENDVLWMVIHKKIITFNFKSKEFEEIITDYGPLSDEFFSFNCIYKDRSGVLWLGTAGHGIYKLISNPKKFEKVVNFDAPVRSIYGLNENLSGNIIAECQGRLVEVDIKNGKYLRTLTSSPNLLSKNFNLNGSRTAIELESGVYLAVHKSNLWKWDEKNQTVEAIYMDPGIPRFSSFCADADGRIWICSSEGLIKYNPKNQEIKKYPLPVETRNMEFFWRMAGMIYRHDRSDFIWICTYEGLLRFSLSQETWKIYRNDPKNNNSISQNLIFSVCADPMQPNDYLWIGTSGSGLSKLNIHTDNFEHFTTEDGLSNNYIYGILSDDLNRLWLSTNKGLSCFDPVQKKFVNYLKQDGLQGNEFNRFSYYKTKNGILVFGGVNGLTFFDPKLIVKNTITPSVVITSIKINNSDKHSALTLAPSYTDFLDLDYKNNSISFQFAALEFTNPELNKYRYKMVGVSDDWIDIAYDRSVNFSNLAPGSYTFVVSGSNSDGVWSEQVQQVLITIRPPWWETWWFRILLLFAVSLAIYAGVRYRINQLRRVQYVRDRIARDLHDEIGSTLSSISIYTEVVKNKVQNQNPEVDPLLSKISSGTLRVMESMSDIVWAINSRNDSLDNLSARIQALISELEESTPFKIEFFNDDTLNTLSLPMEKRKNVYLIFKEALNNALKYSNAERIAIRLVRHKGGVLLEVKDDGVGFDLSSSANGNGLDNMRSRAEAIRGVLDIESANGRGTVIRLFFNLN